MSSRSFVFIKPDGVRRNLIGEIIGYFEKAGLKVDKLQKIEPDEATVNKHYPLDDRDYILTLGHRDISGLSDKELKAFYQKNLEVVKRLHKYVLSGPIVKMILIGTENPVAKVREVVGKTNPADSPKGSIRGDLGIDSFVKSDAEERACENLVHASGTPAEAEREIKLWFGEDFNVI
ncbi:nucleoside-diphosphate kinase [Patescibacteria group bacterium]|nr:nucleoside-diphosphate kinase [Patescibacteria group bacterium]